MTTQRTGGWADEGGASDLAQSVGEEAQEAIEVDESWEDFSASCEAEEAAEAEENARREREALEHKVGSFPHVSRPRQCARTLADHPDFTEISPVGIELAARHIAEVLKEPCAVIIGAGWRGMPDGNLWVHYAVRRQGRPIEGLFPGVPCHAEGPIEEHEFPMAEIDLKPPTMPDRLLLDLGYSAAEAYELQLVLEERGWTPQQEIRHCIARTLPGCY